VTDGSETGAFHKLAVEISKIFIL